MTDILKIKGTEVSIASANTVASQTLLRIYNSGASDGVLTVSYANGTTYANCTVATKTIIYIRKNTSDTVQGTSMLACPIAYQ